MPFPQTNRGIYAKNPLVEVVCQLRFPPILSINQSNLADFQSHIRDVYPLYSTSGSEGQSLHEFSTEDEK
ncbi:hypothetical protein LBMAG21_08710 [Armatimonadota bacterium]|nr:hypothetical protein LBMAG21_08710 [Armatimonadota bacterium]